MVRFHARAQGVPGGTRIMLRPKATQMAIPGAPTPQMARIPITEFRAKKILLGQLNLPYDAISLSDSADAQEQINKFVLRKIKKLSPKMKYVLKVDDGIKKRMKKGLIALGVTPAKLREVWSRLKKEGYKRFLVEKFIGHESDQEKFLSLERTREGVLVYYSNKGGIDIEENRNEVQKDILTTKNVSVVANFLGLPTEVLEKIKETFDKFYFSFLEINPLLVKDREVHFLDMAVEVDSSGSFFVENWTEADFGRGSIRKTQEEKNVESLSRRSQASLKLDVISADGSIFMLLSGGGASIVLADEVYNLGYGGELANYGEYSGNPSDEETYLYTKNVLSLLLDSQAPKKVLIIAGGVANFTDIRTTFNGIIRALDENKDGLRQHGVKVFVRRGGPHQEEALKNMEEFLKKEGLYGRVCGPDVVLTDIVNNGMKWIHHV